jgi:hypothetical protein
MGRHLIKSIVVNTLSRLRASVPVHQGAAAPKVHPSDARRDPTFARGFQRRFVLGSLQHERPSIEDRKAERELFFWTVRQALLVVLLAALTAYVVVSLVEGRFPAELLLHYPGLPQIPG